MKHFALRSFVIVFAAGLLFFCLPLAPAQQAGFDLLQTGSGAVINLSTVPGVSPSTVKLQGVPICPCTGNTDTIMRRTAAVPPGGGTVPLEVVALFMKSVGPVTYSGRSVDIYITVNNSNGVIGQGVLPQPDALPASTGTLTVRTNGTFDSSISIHADVIVVGAGADVRNPATHLAHRAAPVVNLSSSNNVWSTIPPAGYPPECFFPANGFYPGGGVPETAPDHSHPVVPSGPPVGPNGARCIFFNPAAVSAADIGGRWRVVDGGQLLFDFDTRMADAQKTVSIIQHYHMTESCTVGTNLPGEETPPMQYELVSGNAPTGSMTGEDCIPFDNATVTDQDISGRWTIVDGSQWMFNFGPQHTDADNGVTIIKHYVFNQSCFVGRPDTGGRYVFTYMKAGPPIPIIIRPPKTPIEFRKLPPGPGPVEKVAPPVKK